MGTHSQERISAAVAMLVVLTVVLVAAVAMDRGRAARSGFDIKKIFAAAERGNAEHDDDPNTPDEPHQRRVNVGLLSDLHGRGYAGRPVLEGLEPSPDEAFGDAPQRRSVYAALNRLYSTADVDPLVTGHLYDYSDGIRNTYAARTSLGDVHGLTEYSSSGSPGDVGVDIGPYGLDEYGGKMFGYDDGIPEAWALPSTPVRYYAPKERDYYGPEGATPYAANYYTLTEPDHDPLVS